MWRILFSICYLAHLITCQTISETTVPVISSAFTPIWDDDSQSLYFVSISANGQQLSIFRYIPHNGLFYSAYIDGYDSPSFILPAKCKNCKNVFVVGVENKVIKIQWDGVSNRANYLGDLFSMDANIPKSHTALAKISPSGRFFGGSFSDLRCKNATADFSIYRYDSSQGLVQLVRNVVASTGFAFNLNDRKMYQLDTCQLVIAEFDWDPTTGNICNGRLAFDFKKYNNLVKINAPLGLEIDTNGKLYVAQGQSVWVIDPRSSKLMKTIDFPAPLLNGLSFGGPKMDILYVAVAPDYSNPFTLEVVANPTNATSSIYALTGLGVAGYPTQRLEIN